MGNNNQKIMTVSFAMAGALVWLVVGLLLTTLAETFAVVERVLQYDLVRAGITIGLGLLTFALLQFNPKVTTWAEEVIVEIRKVVWPTREQTIAMTIAVIIIIFVCAFALGGFDLISGKVITSGIEVLQNMFR